MLNSSRELVVVDDDEGLFVLIEEALALTRWKLTRFSDADEALAYLGSNRPAALMVDIRMPKMDGDEVLDRLAESDRLDGVSVFVSSSVEPPDSVWRDFDKHGARFVLKEDVVDQQRLLDHLDRRASARD